MFKKKSPISELKIWNRDAKTPPKLRLEQDLAHYISITDEETGKALSTIEDIMLTNKMDYYHAVRTEEGKRAMYLLLLHRQWIAFHLESLRIITSEEGNQSYENYEEAIQNEVGKSAMSKLINQFIEETELFFSRKVYDN